MYRKIMDYLKKWKSSEHRKPLILQGARQVGKTYSILEFGRTCYENVAYFNFETNPKLNETFAENISPDYLIPILSHIAGQTIIREKTLIVFDEVQLFPRARQAIKYLVADGRYKYIETGSLLSIKKNTRDILIPSEEHKISMYPMDFEEFLWAMGNDTLMDFIKKCYEEKKPLTDLLHRKAMDYFKQYLIVGGMPQVVMEYINTNDFSKVDLIKRNLLYLYRNDIRKHADELNLKVEQIFDTIPSQLQKHEKKFNLSAIDESARYREYEGAFYWLEDAGLINVAYNTTEPNIGLGQRIDNNALKCYFFDTGLLLSLVFNEKKIINEEIYKKRGG